MKLSYHKSRQKYLWQPIVKRDNVIVVRNDSFLFVWRQQTDLGNEVLGLHRRAIEVDPEGPRLPELITAHLQKENVAVSLKFGELEKRSELLYHRRHIRKYKI